MSKTMFSANRVEEVSWEVTIDGQSVKMSDKYMEELAVRFLKSRNLKTVDKDGNSFELKGLFSR